MHEGELEKTTTGVIHYVSAWKHNDSGREEINSLLWKNSEHSLLFSQKHTETSPESFQCTPHPQTPFFDYSFACFASVAQCVELWQNKNLNFNSHDFTCATNHHNNNKKWSVEFMKWLFCKVYFSFLCRKEKKKDIEQHFPNAICSYYHVHAHESKHTASTLLPSRIIY
jgi:hypothetical protein